MRCVNGKEFRKAMIEVDCTTFGDLEEKAGIDRTTLANVAKGSQKPSYDSIVKLSDTFHLTYEEIGRIFFCNEITDT